MTDDDKNEETARARHRTMFYQRLSSVLNGVLTHSAETLVWLGAITHHQVGILQDIKRLFTLRITRCTWSATDKSGSGTFGSRFSQP